MRSTETVWLRPATDEDDLLFLYTLAVTRPQRWARVASNQVLRPKGFVELVEHDCTMQLIAEIVGQPIGAASLYGIDRASGTVWLDVVPAAGQDGRFGEMARELVGYAFSNWAFRKVYLRRPDIGPGTEALRDIGLVEEGRLRDHIRHGGSFVDEIVDSCLLVDYQLAASGLSLQSRGASA